MHLVFPNIFLLLQALYHALPMDYVTIAKLQGKLDGEASLNTVRKLLGRIVVENILRKYLTNSVRNTALFMRGCLPTRPNQMGLPRGKTAR